MAYRWRVLGIIGVLTVISSGSIGVYLVARHSSSDSEIHRLIDGFYNHQRPGGGRLSAAAYTKLDDALVARPDVGRAQILVLQQPHSQARQHLQGLVYLAAGEWQKFIDLVKNPSVKPSNDAALLNNLGASFLALSEQNPTFLLGALDAFEQASKSDPRAPEPVFNLIVTYRRLHFDSLAADALRRYSSLDSSSGWFTEISNPRQEDEASIVDRLENSVTKGDLVEAERIFRTNPELCRRVAMQYALYNEPELPAVLYFIGDEMNRRYQDKTVSAMLAPLFTERRNVTITLREHVNRGAELYNDGKYAESLAAYREATKLVSETDSIFDRLWIDLNRADTEVRLGKFEKAHDTLVRVVTVSEQQQFAWLKAKALSMFGFSFKLTSSYTDMLRLLSDADRELVRLDATHDRIRLLYYLSAYRYYGGDQEEALRLALECLRLTDDDDAGRLSTFEWLIGSILYRSGFTEKSLVFAKESVKASHKARFAAVEVQATVTLADLYQSLSNDKLAAEYLKMAEDALPKLSGYDRVRSELLLNIVKAKVKIYRHEYAEAESLLQRSLNLYERQPFSATSGLLVPSLTLFGRLYSDTGRIKEADQKFTEAIDVVEKDDEYMETERFRVKFDDERRELYDSAITFQFNKGSVDAAWNYLQRYRAKLFLEFLAALNPDIKSVRARLDRTEIQHRIPKETQIAEYLLLKDRLLIWVVSEKVFTVRSVSVNRSDIETKVQAVLQKLRGGDDVDPLLTELGKWLVEPISDLLDPNRSLTIIPDRALHGLPFEALKQPGKSRYLIEDFPILISPSLTHFLTSDGAQPARNGVVGFGSQTGGSTEFKELSALSKIYPEATTFLGPQVDKSSFLAGLQKATVFHYAGHSATDAVDPLRSAILLDGNRSGPNSVTAIDISRQRLPNNAVVILSSCDSSVGNSRDGIGVRGLTSAFLIGGAGSVVGSLWLVESSSTADLMIRFHRAFAKSHLPVAQALREAQLSFMKAFPDRSHPYYWSGFVVTGNFSALR